jgi:eukaryotic-like serine/threonine-protein kinase
MTPERWRQVTEMFHAATGRPAGERRQFLEDACADDDELRAEVGAMLAAHEGAAETPHIPVMKVVQSDQELEPGDRVGPLQVLGLIAAGGMGEVYRARDSRLDREVAVKVLPGLYAADTARLRRFEQEARAAGALTHPNLVTVYDVGLDGGRPYLVTELLDGETLRDRLRRGPMPASRACEIAAALARGLAAAHAKGIVHRDLKPENVIVTRDGRVKIVDFGVAKLRGIQEQIGSGPDTPRAHTESGAIVGTPGYMAPEQVRGVEADGRADVFALGAILFELLTGRRAFERTTRAETLKATLDDDPLASAALVGHTPNARRLVERCLEKDPEARFQSAADLAFALDVAAESTAPPTLVPARAARTATLRMIIAAALLIAASFAVARSWFAREEQRPDRTLLVADRRAGSLHRRAGNFTGRRDDCLSHHRRPSRVAASVRSPHRPGCDGHSARH